MIKLNKPIVATIVAMCAIFASCIQDEALNSEADIVTCTVFRDVLINAPQIENDRIILRIDPTVDRSKIQLEFTLTPGATIIPASSMVLDLTEPKTFKVTSEDKQWEKTYTVMSIVGGIGPGEPGDIVISYDFEHYRIHTAGKKEYYEFYEVNKDGDDQLVWASGNSGFSIVYFGEDPGEYPTSVELEGKTGACVKLETKSTGAMGGFMKMPLAAGNLFLGEFNLQQSTKPLESTHFGEIFNVVPTGLTGYYKYKAGEEYKDKSGKVIKDKTDNFDIYGIFFETDEEVQFLDGNNSLSSPNLISIARIPEESKKQTDEWTHFYIPFEMQPGKSIDPQKLKENKYRVSIVLSSSIDGAYFSGAVGSTLLVDQIELIHLEKN